MAVESKRGCGFRKVGGLYLVGEGRSVSCVMLPYLLEACPVCGEGIKQSMGWKWVKPIDLFRVSECPCLHSELGFDKCTRGGDCPFRFKGLHGLMWVGKKFYTPSSFMEESARMGVSKRISNTPRGFKLGETWVFLGHPEACKKLVEGEGTLDGQKEVPAPGVFHIFMPTRIEKIVTETQAKNVEEMDKLKDKGITPVVVPDDDKDHQGTAYDKEEDSETPPPPPQTPPPSTPKEAKA